MTNVTTDTERELTPTEAGLVAIDTEIAQTDARRDELIERRNAQIRLAAAEGMTARAIAACFEEGTKLTFQQISNVAKTR